MAKVFVGLLWTSGYQRQEEDKLLN